MNQSLEEIEISIENQRMRMRDRQDNTAPQATMLNANANNFRNLSSIQ